MSFPNIQLIDPDDEKLIVELVQFLEQHMRTRNLLRENVYQKQNNFRNILVKLEREYISLKTENSLLRDCNDQQKKTISSLEGRICKLDSQIDSLLYKLNSANNAIRIMQQELKDRDKQLKQYVIEKQKIIQKFNNKIQAEIDRLTKELETKFDEQREQLKSCIKKKDNKLKLMKQILLSDLENTSDNVVSKIPINTCSRMKILKKIIPMNPRSSAGTSIDSQDPSTSTVVSTDIAATTTIKSDVELTNRVDDASGIEPSMLSRRDKIPVVNPRYRRSQSADRWIDHRPAGMVPVGTILQPQTPHKRNVTKLTNPKAFVDKSARYCLYAQEQDTDGELETKLYKADVLPTSGGGAQVVFNDVECLKQVYPTKAKRCNGQTNTGNGSVHS